MKKRILTSMLTWLLAVTAYQSYAVARGLNNSNMVIDNMDSVFFDLSQAAYQSGAVEFPVYFNSNDTINAVDFSFRFNQSLLVLDTIMDVTSGLQSTYFLNPGDSVLRFSSYNLSVIPNLTNVVMVRFLINGPSIAIPDIYNVDVFLNGFRCSWRVFDGTNAVSESMVTKPLLVWPNPTDDFLLMESREAGSYKILDFSGRVWKSGEISVGSRVGIDVSSLPSGLQTIRLESSTGPVVSKILICH